MKSPHLSLIEGGFTYLVEHFAPDGTLLSQETTHNLMPLEGLNYVPAVVFKKAQQAVGWWIAPFEGNYDPVLTSTAASIAAEATECTAYTPETRVPFAPGPVAVGALDNTAQRAEFTFTQNKRIYGGFLVSSSVKGGTTGTLMSVVRFASPKDCDAGSLLRITAAVGFSNLPPETN